MMKFYFNSEYIDKEYYLLFYIQIELILSDFKIIEDLRKKELFHLICFII